MFQDGRLFWFRLRPHYSLMWAAVGVVAVGALAAIPLWRAAEMGDRTAQSHLSILIVATVSIAGMLIIAATSRFWFKHLRQR